MTPSDTHASRRLDVTSERALAVAGRILRAAPFSLALIDTVGGHPLAGGVLRMALPRQTGLTSAGAHWTHLGADPAVRLITVALSAEGDDACVLRLTAVARPGKRVSDGARAELEAALDAVDGAVRAEDAFAPPASIVATI